MTIDHEMNNLLYFFHRIHIDFLNFFQRSVYSAAIKKIQSKIERHKINK